jgi:dTDP-4-amino-4,6-dideoxygalactose transaminase
MKSDPLVSVIIPSYDRPAFLKQRSIASLLRQSYANWELIVVGEGPDNRAIRNVVDGFRDSRFRYAEIVRPDYSKLSNEERWHVAGAAARNYGLCLARGEIIAPLDDDDEFLPHHLEDSVELLLNESCDFLYGYVFVRDIESGTDQQEDWLSWADPRTQTIFRERNIVFHSTVAYSAKYRHLRYPTDGALPADYGLWLRIHSEGARFGSLDKPQAIYYGDNLTSTVRVSVPSLPPAFDLEVKFDAIRQRRILSNTGPVCTELEAAVAHRVGLREVVAAPSGDTALMIAFRALALTRSKGRKGVILPSYSHPSLVNAAIWNGFRPTFCDVDSDTLCVTCDLVEPLIDDDTAVIAVVHAHGHPCDMPALERLARDRSVSLLGDAAAAFGASVEGRQIGSWGDIEIFSLSGTKALTAGEGGLLCSREDEIIAVSRRIARYGIGDDSIAMELGINGKLSEMAAAVALCGLPYIDGWLTQRRKAEAIYRDRLAQVPRLKFPHPAAGDCISACKDAVLILESVDLAVRVRHYLKSHRIDTRPYYRPLHLMPAFAHIPRGNLAGTERVGDCTVCVPLYNEIRSEIVELVAELVREALVS